MTIEYVGPEPENADARDAARWRFLSSLECNSFSIGRNENHACNYMTAAAWIEGEYQDFQDVPPDELQRMKDTNTIWALQIYPNTPIGFNIWHGASMESVVDQAMKDYS
jgi:hypothetical protein